MPRYKTSLRREVPQLQAPKDTTMPTFETQDTQGVPTGGGGSSGPPKWLLIGGVVVVGLGLLVLMKRKEGGGSSAAAPTQTQESLALGDLAYQLENGLGALGIQAQKNRDYLEANENALARSTWYNIRHAADPNYTGADLGDYNPNLNSYNGYSILGYQPPRMGPGSAWTPDNGYRLR